MKINKKEKKNPKGNPTTEKPKWTPTNQNITYARPENESPQIEYEETHKKCISKITKSGPKNPFWRKPIKIHPSKVLKND